MRFERLRQVAGHPRRDALVPFAGERVRRERINRQPAAFRQCADRRSGREPVEHRHLHVHQDQVVVVPGDRFHGRLSVAHDVHGVAALSQHRRGHFLVDRIVLGEQYAEMAACLLDGVTGDHRAAAVGRQCGAQHGGDAHDQLGARDRLGEVGLDAEVAAALRVAFLAHRREHQQARAAVPAVAAHGLGELEAVPVGHLAVDDREVVGRARELGAVQRAEAGVRGRRLVDRGARARQHLADDAPVGRVVVDHQDTRAPQLRGRRQRVGQGRLQGEVQQEREIAAASQRALHMQLAAHDRHQAPHDGEPQAGAPVAPGGGRVRLAELLEDHVELVGGDADPRIADRELHRGEPALDRRQPHGDHHLATLGELERVAEQVGDDLAQAAGIAADGAGDVRAHVAQQLHRPLRAAAGQQACRGVDEAREVERNRFELEAAALDLRDVENVVDDGEQALGRGLNQA